MPKSEWEELLGHSGISDTSQSDIVREVVSNASGSSASTLGGLAGGVSGAANNPGSSQQDANNEIVEQMSSLASQISSLNSTQESAVSAIQGNTQAVTQNTSSKGSGSSVASQAGSAAESLFGGALSLSPLISGLMSLFGGGSSAPSTQMAPFMLPAPVQYQAGVSGTPGGPVTPVSYGAGDQPRSQSTSAPTQVTVQVNAMDSQSFLDHSDDIANAVKAALLNSNALGDVISDL
jgi:hypothetical protein